MVDLLSDQFLNFDIGGELGNFFADLFSLFIVLPVEFHNLNIWDEEIADLNGNSNLKSINQTHSSLDLVLFMSICCK